jgi:hypothetical protein
MKTNGYIQLLKYNKIRFKFYHFISIFSFERMLHSSCSTSISSDFDKSWDILRRTEKRMSFFILLRKIYMNKSHQKKVFRLT